MSVHEEGARRRAGEEEGAARSFEQAFEELEEIVSRLEAGDLPLDDSVRLYERGRELVRFCEGLLDKAELRVTSLNEAP